MRLAIHTAVRITPREAPGTSHVKSQYLLWTSQTWLLTSWVLKELCRWLLWLSHGGFVCNSVENIRKNRWESTKSEGTSVVYFLDQNLFHFWQQKVLPVLHWVHGRAIEFFPQPLSWVMQSQLHHVTGKSNQVQKNWTKKGVQKTCCSCDSSSVFQIETTACFPL